MSLAVQRPYQPVSPANNFYLAQRWDQEVFLVHRKKVAAAKAVIDNKPPKVHMHLHIKLKKLQFEAERLATIERDNRILLEKMCHIMRAGGVVDNRKDGNHAKSLNKTKRQRELLRITHENLAILKRLTTKDPHYNHKKWLCEWQVSQQYLMNISKFPHPWRQNKSPYDSTSSSRQDQDSGDMSISGQPVCAVNAPPTTPQATSCGSRRVSLTTPEVPKHCPTALPDIKIDLPDNKNSSASPKEPKEDPKTNLLVKLYSQNLKTNKKAK